MLFEPYSHINNCFRTFNFISITSYCYLFPKLWRNRERWYAERIFQIEIMNLLIIFRLEFNSIVYYYYCVNLKGDSWIMGRVIYKNAIFEITIQRFCRQNIYPTKQIVEMIRISLKIRFEVILLHWYKLQPDTNSTNKPKSCTEWSQMCRLCIYIQ